jgi:hypothetical protein
MPCVRAATVKVEHEAMAGPRTRSARREAVMMIRRVGVDFVRRMQARGAIAVTLSLLLLVQRE